jgi:hypothetical protein
MKDELRTAIQKGELILFLGAGASRGCVTASGDELLDGTGLAKYLASIGNYEYLDEPLDEVYGALRSKLRTRLDPILEGLFRNARPSNEYSVIASYAWRRIYTLNIDDALETAIRRSGVQKLHVRQSFDPIVDQDSFFDRLDLVKLNGTIDRIEDGVIFSASEYAKATAKPLPWYEQCASDFVRCPILFVGTKLSEPLLKFHIERYKAVTGRSPGRSYVITPSATELQVATLSEYNIEHISGTLADFVSWLAGVFPSPLVPIDLAKESIPQLAELLKSPDAQRFASLFDHVTPVRRNSLKGHGATSGGAAIKDFYKGFRPTWQDIVDDIPAELDVLSKTKEVLKDRFSKNSFLPLIGPAGSGKTTLLMQLCYEVSRSSSIDVYYIEQPIDRLRETLEAIEKTARSSRVLVGIDNIDFVSDQLQEALDSKRLQKTMVVGAERENIWKRKTRVRLGAHSLKPVYVSEFSNEDAERILEKLERYGSWTRLGQLSHKKRVAELVVRAQKQLLIALLEATFGLGYGQIIASDYSTLTTDEERLSFLTIGLVTDRKQDAPQSLVDRALSSLGILNREAMLRNNLSGIVVERSGKLAVRHPIYIRYILDNLVDPSLVLRALKALLAVFAQYESPVIKHVDRLEATIYKGLLNHAFLRDVLKGRREVILSLYQDVEKKFEQDGLFWLQYGLALRDLREHEQSLEKLRLARQAYPMDHTQHALGQQLLIVADTVSDKNIALAYAKEAMEILDGLDSVIESDDTFPIVTLAEGYTKVLRRHEGPAIARREAARFAERLKSRIDSVEDDERLKIAYENMFRYAATGTWIEAD